MTAKTFLSNQFTKTHSGRRLVAEASDLSLRPGEVFGAIYNDACDQGLYVRSEKTGKLAAFCLYEEQRDKDGNITAWVFHATRPHQSMFVNGPFASWHDVEGMQVIIFND